MKQMIVDDSGIIRNKIAHGAAGKELVIMVTHDVVEAVLLSNRIVMLTNGPAATIGDILDVNLPRPRERLKLAKNPHYHQLRGKVLEFLYQRQMRPTAETATKRVAV